MISNTLLLWIVTILYSAQAGLLVRAGHYAGATILGGYVVANLGLIWSLKP